MTDGHKHRLLRVKSFDTLFVRVLRTPVWHRPALTNDAWRRIERSPYPYGPCAEHSKGLGLDATCWVLTPLSILHRWTGLTLSNAPKHTCGDKTCTEAHP